MDVEDLEPQKKRPEPKKLEEMSIEALSEYIAELEAEVARVREAIETKREARAGAHSIFKR